jgi:hypothetical protein
LEFALSTKLVVMLTTCPTALFDIAAAAPVSRPGEGPSSR